MKRSTKKAIQKTVVITGMLVGVFILVSILTFRLAEQEFEISRPLINEKVWNYKPVVEKYAKQYGVTEYVDVLLAMMMQESGGRGNDPMQSSESYCGHRGCIDNPERSIEQGVYYFSEAINEADGDLKLAVQSYNFGRGFIDYVHQKSGTYSIEVAIDFSQKMYRSAENQSIYSCLREEAKQYNACYGDIYYVRDVMQYKQKMTAEK
ncbi:lysozyme family protein [Virgibacillus siamensis]|uniref:lysozyme family protein n=1 Tax=Virgibacillus siamensis TaxID=480071 RepID=UPI00098540E0|nr:lysozyme family protein [Virgibacillus siamensis]